jgi:hypothetical protein
VRSGVPVEGAEVVAEAPARGVDGVKPVEGFGDGLRLAGLGMGMGEGGALVGAQGGEIGRDKARGAAAGDQLQP